MRKRLRKKIAKRLMRDYRTLRAIWDHYQARDEYRRRVASSAMAEALNDYFYPLPEGVRFVDPLADGDAFDRTYFMLPSGEIVTDPQAS